MHSALAPKAAVAVGPPGAQALFVNGDKVVWMLLLLAVPVVVTGKCDCIYKTLCPTAAA